MSSCNYSGKSLLARFRGSFGHRSRALCIGVLLMGSVLGGVPIRPEEIEEHMRAMSRAKIVQLLEHEQQPSGDPPDNGSEVRLTAESESSLVHVRELRGGGNV